MREVELRVRKILATDIRARGDDKWLLWRVWSQFTNIYIPFEDFSKLPAAESISRCRRKIQNDEGLFLPNDKIVALREEREREVRKWALQSTHEAF